MAQRPSVVPPGAHAIMRRHGDPPGDEEGDGPRQPLFPPHQACLRQLSQPTMSLSPSHLRTLSSPSERFHSKTSLGTQFAVCITNFQLSALTLYQRYYPLLLHGAIRTSLFLTYVNGTVAFSNMR